MEEEISRFRGFNPFCENFCPRKN